MVHRMVMKLVILTLSLISTSCITYPGKDIIVTYRGEPFICDDLYLTRHSVLGKNCRRADSDVMRKTVFIGWHKIDFIRDR